MIFGLRHLALAIAAVLAGSAISPTSAVSHSLTTLYSFCTDSRCRDGTDPSGIVSDVDGNLFGVAQGGGNGNRGGYGTIYELKNGRTFTELYRFCAGGEPCPNDGHRPVGPLVVDAAGNLYGVALQGGINNRGTAFELLRTKHGWQFQKLHDFCSQGGSQCADGYSPFSSLTYAGAASGALYDGVSPLYGVTSEGGNGNGVAYQLVPNGHSAWEEAVLHTFCSQGGTNCTDGAVPGGNLLVDSNGDLLGTTSAGGANHPSGFAAGGGVVFALVLSGGSWAENVLYSFCAQPNCTDGAIPLAALVQDATGDIFGTTSGGGNACPLPNNGTGCGTAYKLSSDETGWHETMLHAFCGRTDCSDGATPLGPLLLDSSGNLFGTAQYGGGNDSGYQFGSGVLYKLSGATFKVLHSFCALDVCTDGSFPNSAMIMTSKGKLIGMTDAGGTHGRGSMFSLKP